MDHNMGKGDQIKAIDAWYKDIADKYSVNFAKIPLLPFMESNYLLGELPRVMHLGINAYLAFDDWPDKGKRAQEDWWRNNASGSGKIWPVHQYFNKQISLMPRSVNYRTNLVKIWFPASEGKEAKQVDSKIFEHSVIVSQIWGHPNP